MEEGVNVKVGQGAESRGSYGTGEQGQARPRVKGLGGCGV